MWNCSSGQSGHPCIAQILWDNFQNLTMDYDVIWTLTFDFPCAVVSFFHTPFVECLYHERFRFGNALSVSVEIIMQFIPHLDNEIFHTDWLAQIEPSLLQAWISLDYGAGFFYCSNEFGLLNILLELFEFNS